MNDTYVTVIGNALHEPEWRRTTNTGALVTTFKIASTARRLNRQTGQWVDGNSLRVRVNCWRGLASNVKNSVTRGDPLIVTGRLCTRDWTDENGVKRTLFELEAVAVGHDLTRGRAVFERVRANTSTSAIEDAEAEQRIGGELTEVVPDDQAPAQFDDRSFEAVFDQPPDDPGDPDAPAPAPTPAPAAGPSNPFGPADDPEAIPPDGSEAAEAGPADGGPADDEEPEPAEPSEEPARSRRRGLRRTAVPA